MLRALLSSTCGGQGQDQDGRFDTLISSLGQLVVELLSFVFTTNIFVLKRDIRTNGLTNGCTHAKFNIEDCNNILFSSDVTFSYFNILEIQGALRPSF